MSINRTEIPGIKSCWLVFFLFFCALHLSAQETITFENGSFELLISANYKGVNSISKVPANPNGVLLDYGGVEKPQLQFRLQNVKWDGIDGASLVVKSSWVSSSPGIKKYTTRDINLKRSSRKKNILFQPQANGKQTITIKYGILKSGDDENALQPLSANTIVKEIIVKGLKETQNIAKVDPPKFVDPEVPETGENSGSENSNLRTTNTGNANNNPPPIKDWPIGLSGNTYSFKDGSVNVRLISGNEFYSINGPTAIDFTGNNNPQVTLQFSDLKLKDPASGGKMVIRPGWLSVSENFSPINFNGIELGNNETKSIPIRVKGNSDGFVRLKFGYKSATGLVIGPVGSGINKNIRISGLGTTDPNQTASTVPLNVDPTVVAAEDKAWQLAKQENTFSSYLAYWNQYRNTGKYSKECAYLISKINIDYEIPEQKETNQGKQYTIRLNNVQRFTIDTTTIGEGLIANIDENNNIIATITDGKKHTFKILAQFRRSVELVIDPKIPPIKAAFQNDENGDIKFQISGGKKGTSYYLYVIDVNTNKNICDLGKADTITNILKKEYIYRNCPLNLDGEYKIEVKDVRKTERVVSGNTFLLKSSDNKGILSYLWVVLLVLLIPIGIIIKKNL